MHTKYYVGLIVLILLVFLYKKAYETTVYWFHRPGCPACEKMKVEWSLFVKTAPWLTNVVAVDTTDSTNDELASNFEFTTVPHIVKVCGNIRTVYSGKRTASSISEWASA